MKTKSLELLPQTPELLLALIAGKDVYERRFSRRLGEGVHEIMASAGISQEYLTKLKHASGPDPWTFGFVVLLSAENLIIGACGFKGPPGADGIVEIAYGFAPAFCGRGYATEAAQALVIHALEDERVRTVRAHTLPEANASARVLTKCGFQRIGEVTDPDDGLVWRWEYAAANTDTTPHAEGHPSIA